MQNEVQSPIRIDTPTKCHSVSKEETKPESPSLPTLSELSELPELPELPTLSELPVLPSLPTKVEPVPVEMKKEDISSDIKMRLSEGVFVVEMCHG